MTSDEVIKKLNLSPENVEEDENGNITLHYDNATIFNQKANVRLLFDVQTKINLQTIAIDFQDVDTDDLINKIGKEYGDGEYTEYENGRVLNWWGEKIIDLPSKIQDRFIDLEELKYSYTSMTFSEERVWNGIKNTPLISVGFLDSTLVYNADYMAVSTILSDDEKYNEWIEYIESLYKNRPEPASTTDSN